jgi:hypothetical protein
MFKFLLLFILFFTFVNGQTDQKNIYPTTEKDRPLVLPKGKLEVDGGIVFLSKRNDLIKPYVNIRYAISKNLEIERLGLRYRFFSNEPWQAAIVLENYGIGIENNEICHHTKFEMETKYISKTYYSLLMQLGYYFAQAHSAEGRNDGQSNELRFTFGIPIKLFYSNTITITSAIRLYNYEAYGHGSALFFKFSSTQNIVNSLDFVMEMALSTFNEATDSVLFNESYGRQINFRLRWRFF